MTENSTDESDYLLGGVASLDRVPPGAVEDTLRAVQDTLADMKANSAMAVQALALALADEVWEFQDFGAVMDEAIRIIEARLEQHLVEDNLTYTDGEAEDGTGVE